MVRGKPKQAWSDLSVGKKAGVVGAVALQATIAAVAQADLSARPEQKVRGPKLLWRVATLNTGGALAYFVVGRRR